MKLTNLPRLLTMIVIAMGAVGGAGVEAQAPDTDPSGGEASTVSREDTTTLAQLEALYRARTEEAQSRFTQADVDFMTGMIAHHAQALVMSNLVPTHGANPAVQTLAARIINSQRDEIRTMQRWLREREQAVPEVHIEGLNVMIHDGGDHGHHHMMPGMLTQEQLEELDAARGKAFDRLFLTYMIQHHSGAITMVDELFATDGAAQDDAAFKIASDINVDQSTEIARMQRMLEAMTGAG